MVLCVKCGGPVDESLHCPACGWGPDRSNGITVLVQDRQAYVAGYKPHFFEQLAAAEETNFWFRNRNKLIVQLIRRFFPAAESFLDIGCGTGFMLSAIEKEFPRMKVSGSEIFSEGLFFAAKRLRHAELYQMDALNIPFREEFDLVGAFDVLEHIEQDEAVLHQICKALKPRGGIVVTVPQHRFLWSRVDDHSCHMRRYEAGDLRTKIESAGFSVIFTSSFVSLLLPVLFLSRRIGNRDRDSFDLLKELKLSAWKNALLGKVLDVERMLIAAGVKFPLGGSLVMLAIKN